MTILEVIQVLIAALVAVATVALVLAALTLGRPRR